MSEENNGSQNSGNKKNKMKDRFKEIRSNVESFISDINVDDLKKSFGMMMKDAENDFNKLVNKDLETMKKKLQEEKADFEQKAKKFMAEHQKELDGIQSKFKQFVAATKQAAAKTRSKKSTQKEATPKKKATTKAATPKTAAPKAAKATKKVSKKASKKS